MTNQNETLYVSEKVLAKNGLKVAELIKEAKDKLALIKEWPTLEDTYLERAGKLIKEAQMFLAPRGPKNAIGVTKETRHAIVRAHYEVAEPARAKLAKIKYEAAKAREIERYGENADLSRISKGPMTYPLDHIRKWKKAGSPDFILSRYGGSEQMGPNYEARI